MSLGQCTFPVATSVSPYAPCAPCGLSAERLTEGGLRCPEHLRCRLTPLALEARWLLERAEAVEETYRGVGPVSARDVVAGLDVAWE